MQNVEILKSQDDKVRLSDWFPSWLAHHIPAGSPLSIIWFESFDTFPRFSVGTLNIVCDEQRHLCYSIAVR
jgi:hypothetical protein